MKLYLLALTLHEVLLLVSGIPVPASDKEDSATPPEPKFSTPLATGCKAPSSSVTGQYSTDECLDLYKRVVPSRLRTTFKAITEVTRLYNKVKVTGPQGAAQAASKHTYKDGTKIRVGDIVYAKVDSKDKTGHAGIVTKANPKASTIEVAKMSTHAESQYGKTWDKTKTVNAGEYVDTSPGTGSVKPETKLHLKSTNIATAGGQVEQWDFNGRHDHKLSKEQLKALLKNHEPARIIGGARHKPKASRPKDASQSPGRVQTNKQRPKTPAAGRKNNVQHKPPATATKPAPNAPARRPSNGDPGKKGGK